MAHGIGNVIIGLGNSERSLDSHILDLSVLKIPSGLNSHDMIPGSTADT